MITEKNVQTVKDFFAAIGRGDKQGLLALCAEDIEWIIPGEDWPLAGTHRGHAGLADLLQKASELETSYPGAPRICSAGRPGSRRRFRYGEGQSHEQDVRGPLGLRHYRSKWQTDEHQGVYRHASTGAGLRAPGSGRIVTVHVAMVGHPSRHPLKS
jgi:SnoaL-like domain